VHWTEFRQIHSEWMHVVYLSQQSRLTLLNMLTQLIRKSFTQRCAFSKFHKWKSLIFPLLLPTLIFPKLELILTKLSLIGYLSMIVCINWQYLSFPTCSKVCATSSNQHSPLFYDFVSPLSIWWCPIGYTCIKYFSKSILLITSNQ